MSDDAVPMIRWFEKAPGDALVGEARIEGISLSNLQSIFGVPADNPMYDSWPVAPEHALALQPHVMVQLDLVQYDYFVECDAPDIK